MPTYEFIGPCGGRNKVKLDDEVTAVACAWCGSVVMVQTAESAVVRKKAPKKKEPKKPPPPPLSHATLEANDDGTSAAVIAAFAASAAFRSFAKAEMQAILARDAEDEAKLAEGIALAVAKGAVPPKKELPLEALRKIDVLGKTADEVALEIVYALGDAPSHGCALVLQGLSGTGKGTTVAKLAKLLPRCSTWSNGNIFRALTLLAVRYFEDRGLPFSAEALSPALLAQLVGCLHFEAVKGHLGVPKFDVRIEGHGVRAMVSQVENTLLKDPSVGRNIPTVARVTQGEVISFAAKCVDAMRQAGCNVLLEGRSQTLDYVRAPGTTLARGAPLPARASPSAPPTASQPRCACADARCARRIASS